MKIVECVGCGNMIGANEEDAQCDKCLELDKLRNKVLKYEKALCALLNLACEDTQDGMIDIITDTLQGFELMEQYEEDSLEGTNVLAQFIGD